MIVRMISVAYLRPLVIVLLALLPLSAAAIITNLRRIEQRPDPCELPEARGVRVLLKTNLLNDALLTPDVGIEIGFTPHWSLSLDGHCAWWSKDSAHRYWRVAGGSAEMRYWIVPDGFSRVQTGHHLGLAGGLGCFDFEFGGKGRQSQGPFWNAGMVYGYSFPLGKRLSLDLSVKVGAAWGKTVSYHPECGVYVCDRHTRIERFGPIGLGVTLVWYPGRGDRNVPAFEYH